MATFPSKVNYTTGEVLTATNMNDVGGAINLLQSAQFAAGKNAIINGDFGIWQRGTSFTLSTGGAVYTADRFKNSVAFSAGTCTVSRQTFTAGTAPVAGYEASYFNRTTLPASGSITYYETTQFVEDVRTFAGQTVTFSFWAKASSSLNATILISQNFGSGGSASVDNYAGSASITTSWQRFTITTSLASISGKTIGTSSFVGLYLYATSGLSTSMTIDTWGWQLEAASTASNFQTATGTKQGELAACQRYYIRWNGSDGINSIIGTGLPSSAGAGRIVIPLPVTMRTTPATLDYSSLAINYVNAQVAITTATISGSGLANPRTAGIEFSGASGLTAYWSVTLVINNTSSGYLGLGAEL